MPAVHPFSHQWIVIAEAGQTKKMSNYLIIVQLLIQELSSILTKQKENKCVAREQKKLKRRVKVIEKKVSALSHGLSAINLRVMSIQHYLETYSNFHPDPPSVSNRRRRSRRHGQHIQP